MESFFRNNPPKKVVSGVEEWALEYVTSNLNVPKEHRDFFNMLADLRNMARDEQNKKKNPE